ncbi:hypothetical protein V8B97DRAFT_2026259 [Scleroderma yunnanense]
MVLQHSSASQVTTREKQGCSCALEMGPRKKLYVGTTQDPLEYVVFKELLCMIPSLEAHLMGSSEEMVTTIAELIQKGINGAGADNTKGHTGALLCPAGLNWTNIETRTKLAFKHIFTSLSSVDQEPKATHSGNAQIHGMHSMTKASIVYTCFALTSAQIFSWTDLMTDSECIVELLDDPDEKEELGNLINQFRQIFPLYADPEHLPFRDSALARICQKWMECRERDMECN